MNACLNKPYELFCHQMYCCKMLTCLKRPIKKHPIKLAADINRNK